MLQTPGGVAELALFLQLQEAPPGTRGLTPGPMVSHGVQTLTPNLWWKGMTPTGTPAGAGLAQVPSRLAWFSLSLVLVYISWPFWISQKPEYQV